MNENRINQLADILYNFSFGLMDGEPELSGDDCGQIAAHLEKEFKKKIEELLG